MGKHSRSRLVLITASALLLVSVACNFPLAFWQPTPTLQSGNQDILPTTKPPAPSQPSATPLPAAGAQPRISLEELAGQVSLDRMLGHLDVLTHIQEYSGFRNSATTGEREGLDYIRSTLQDMDFLMGMGLTFELQAFHVPQATEIGEVVWY
jgi:hypothetical protein